MKDSKRFHDSTGEMVSSNYSERSNLPQEVIMKDYSEVGKDMPIGTPYGIKAIDEQIRADGAKFKSILKPRKI